MAVGEGDLRHHVLRRPMLTALSAATPAPPTDSLPSIGSPPPWIATIARGLALFLLHFVIDFLIPRRPHAPSTREAAGWSAFYIAIPVAFGGWLWWRYGSQQGVEY